MHSRHGWNFIVGGFGLLLFGSVLDITDNFDSLGRFVVIGNTSVQAFLEKLVGYLGGFTVLAIGLVRWIPSVDDITKLKRAEDDVCKARDELELRVEMRTSELSAVNAHLLEEIAERKLAEAALSESEARYREIFDDAPGLLWVEDWSRVKQMIDRLAEEGVADWRAYFADHRDLVIEAYDLAEVLQISNASLDFYGAASFEELADASNGAIVLPEELDAFVEVLLSFIEGRWSGDVSSQDTRMDGSTITLRTLYVLPSAKRDDWSRVIYMLEDITGHRRAEEALRQAQKMEAIGQLTGGIAHDFNNLLQIMIGAARLLQNRVGDDEMAKQSIEALIAAVERGASLTSRLLAFSRQTMLSTVVADVTDLIGSLEDMFRRTLGSTIDLRVEETPALRLAAIDQHQFENALVNLVINARDAMPQGGTLTIETANVTLDETYAEQHEEVTAGDYVQVTVSDTGTGMPPEILDKVFEPFFTTKDVGKGSGLGLSMVYGFAKQSKGHITIYSEVGQGTTVKLYMPRSEKDVAKEEAKNDAREFARGSERILVVEDDENVRRDPVITLRDQGYEVVEAGDGKEAIRHLKNDQHFDLLFTDVVLPGGMNGIEIAEQAIYIQPGIKVLYTTGYAEAAVAQKGQLDPSATLLNKPYRREELLDKVHTLLNSEQLNAETQDNNS